MKKIMSLFLVACLLFACDKQPINSHGNISNTGNTITFGSTRLNMIDIAGGDFILGSQSSVDNKAHNVELSDYQMSEIEITQELFEAVMGYNPSQFKSEPDAGEIQKLRPADRVNWYEAVEFCNKLTKTIMGAEHCDTMTNLELKKQQLPPTGAKKVSAFRLKLSGSGLLVAESNIIMLALIT